MPTRWQHYVPRVYTKAWETTVYSRNQPDSSFQGVYYYEKSDLSIGDGRNRASILAKNQTYTIDFKYNFIFSQCPDIRKEFSDKIKQIFQERKIKAFYNGKPLTNRNSISQNISDLDNWDFYNYDNTVASKRSTINAIKEIRSYALEEKFGSYIESRWESVLQNFLLPFPKENGTGQLEYHFPKTQSVTDMLEMLVIMMCRNPSFNLMGLFPWLKNNLLIPFYSQYGDVNDANVVMRGVWLAEIYKGLYNRKGFVNSFISSAISNFGVVVYKVANDSEGSFITSDNPVVYYNLMVEANNANGIYFPLTPKFTLFLGKRFDDSINDVVFCTVHNQDIRRINRIILNSAETGIVSTRQYLGYIL